MFSNSRICVGKIDVDYRGTYSLRNGGAVDLKKFKVRVKSYLHSYKK